MLNHSKIKVYPANWNQVGSPGAKGRSLGNPLAGSLHFWEGRIMSCRASEQSETGDASLWEKHRPFRKGRAVLWTRA